MEKQARDELKREEKELEKKFGKKKGLAEVASRSRRPSVAMVVSCLSLL